MAAKGVLRNEEGTEMQLDTTQNSVLFIREQIGVQRILGLLIGVELKINK